jgi:UDP-N-acetylmuramoylalanine--D-glutamate ligase
VIGFGEAGPLFTEAFTKTSAARVVLHDDLPAAVAEAQAIAQPGDTVLLAPAGTSFDAYLNFAARGEHFRSLVRGDALGGEEPANGSR